VVVNHSSIYVGHVWHRRFQPCDHQFKYPIFQCLVDLDELDLLAQRNRWFSHNQANLIAFNDRDYLDTQTQDLKTSVTRFARENGCIDVERIMMLSQPKILGMAFNPLTLFYLYRDDQLIGMVAEVHNTPWNERFRYFIPTGDDSSHRYQHEKRFHVSPFNSMDLDYSWFFNTPSNKLFVSLDIRESRNPDDRYFFASFQLSQEPITHLGSLLIRFPLSAVTTLTRIYVHAFRLWLKRVPFYSHPGNTTTQKVGSSHENTNN